MRIRGVSVLFLVMVISALCSASEWKNVDNLGMTALEVAIREGNTADFDAFVTQGIDPNFHGKANFPVFSWAVMFENTDFVKKLFELGADINATDDRGNKPIKYAVTSPRAPMQTVEFLLKNGTTLSKEDFEVLQGEVKEAMRLTQEPGMHPSEKASIEIIAEKFEAVKKHFNY